MNLRSLGGLGLRRSPARRRAPLADTALGLGGFALAALAAPTLLSVAAAAGSPIEDVLARVSRERLANDTRRLASLSPDAALRHVERELANATIELRRFEDGQGIWAVITRGRPSPRVHVLMGWDADAAAPAQGVDAVPPPRAEVAATWIELARVLAQTDFTGSVHFALFRHGADLHRARPSGRGRLAGVLAFDRTGFEVAFATPPVPEVASGVCLEGDLPSPEPRALVAVGHSGSRALLASFAASARKHAPGLLVASRVVAGDGGCLAERSAHALVPLWNQDTPAIQLVPFWPASARHDRDRPLALTRAALATVLPLLGPAERPPAAAPVGPLAIGMGLLMGVGLWGLRRRLADEHSTRVS